MSNASETFAKSILDAENLLKHFNDLNKNPPPPENEVLKRAGLIMAMTAWETYVEDTLNEFVHSRLQGLNDEFVAAFMKSKLDEEIKRLHNPSFDKTVNLFNVYIGLDLSKKWSWNQVDATQIKERLDKYIKLRGDVVHRSVTSGNLQTNSHPVNKDELEKVIRFLKNLVNSTEKALSELQKNIVKS